MPRRRKKKSNKGAIFATIFLIFLMGTSIMGFLHGGDGYEKRKYGDISIEQTHVGWEVELDNDNTLLFQYLPESTRDFEFDAQMQQTLVDGPMFYVTASKDSNQKDAIALAQYYLSETLPLTGDSFVQVAFTDYSTSALPQITCADATPSVPVLLMKEGNETKLYTEGTCIVFEALYSSDFLQLAEKIVYERIGIDTKNLE